MQPHLITLQDTPLKHCSKCKEAKPATTEFFKPHKQGMGGLNPACRTCIAEQSRKYKAEHHEAVIESSRQYRAKKREARAEYGRNYYAANREARAEYARKYNAATRKARTEYARKYNAAHPGLSLSSARKHRANNREAVAENQRKYRAANHEAQITYWQHRRARKRAAEGSYTAADVQRQYKAQKGKCYYCKVRVGKTYHVDHVVPLSRGGSNWPENIVIACPTCNTTKQARLPHEWAEGGRLL